MTLIDKIGLTEEKPPEAEEKGRIEVEEKGDNFSNCFIYRSCLIIIVFRIKLDYVRIWKGLS